MIMYNLKVKIPLRQPPDTFLFDVEPLLCKCARFLDYFPNEVNMSPLENAIQTLSQKGYCCSQILALLILGAQGKENSDLVRSLSGLCHGIAQSGDVCGILTGGCCVLAYLLGRNTEDDTALPGAKIVLEEYMDWFTKTTTEKWGSIRCVDILGEESPEGPDRSHCRELLARSWEQLLGILTMHSISYAAPKR